MATDLKLFNRITIALVAVIGIFISVELMFVFYNANFNPDAAPSFCAVDDYYDCDGVAESPYSRFLGVPLSLWGLGFYIFILFLSLFPFQKFTLFKDFKHPKSYIFTLSTFSIILSAALYYISHFIIGKVCLLCQNLYIINAALLVCSKLGTPVFDLYKNTFKDVKAIISNELWRNILILAIIAGLTALVLINIYKPFNPPIEKLKSHELNTQYKIGKIGNILGSENPKLVIHEYTDYECPYCEISNGMMMRLSKEFKNIRIEHHDFPLDTECNPFIKRSLHENSCIAIYYAKAAKKQGKFWDMAFLLYQNRGNLSEENILKLAEVIDLDIEQLKKDAKKVEEYKKEVKKDILKADSLGINGTPSYVIGIKIYHGIMPYQELKKIVQESL